MSDATLADVRQVLMPGFVGTTTPEWVADRLAAGLGGVCIYGANIVDVPALRALTDGLRAARGDVIIAIDEEGGDVTRIHYREGSPYPPLAALGRVDDPMWTREVAARVGDAVRSVGCGLTFGPVADVNVDPRNPVIGVRSAGDDAASVARHVAAWVRGAQSSGVAACAKHFPGHGDTAVDSHVGLPVVDVPLATLRQRELVPFAAAIAAGVRSIMTSHIIVPAIDPELPATLSPAVLGMLRSELGFDGAIVSDALDMAGVSAGRGIPEAAVLSLAAGCDVLLIGTDNTPEQLDEIEAALVAAVADGRVPRERLADAARRSRALAGAMPTPAAEVDAEAITAIDAVERDRLREAWWLSPHGAAWLADPPVAQVVRVQQAHNIAAGFVPWDPFEGSVVVEPGDVPRLDDGPVVVLGQTVHLDAGFGRTVDALRERHEVLVVDLGWPDPAAGIADIATYGGSRVAGAALRHALTASAA